VRTVKIYLAVGVWGLDSYLLQSTVALDDGLHMRSLHETHWFIRLRWQQT
jgi:hypothetical protein